MSTPMANRCSMAAARNCLQPMAAGLVLGASQFCSVRKVTSWSSMPTMPSLASRHSKSRRSPGTTVGRTRPSAHPENPNSAMFISPTGQINRVHRSVVSTDRIAWLGVVFIATALVTGCGGAGSGGGSGGGGGTTQTPDMGTLTTVSDSYEYTLENAASSLVLGIAGQSQIAGTNVGQESDTGSADSLWH